MRKFVRIAMGVLLFALLLEPMSAVAAPVVTCSAGAQTPYQISGPKVKFVGTFHCSAEVSLMDVTVIGYKDGNQVAKEVISCFVTTDCLADDSATKAWGTHNYQTFAEGNAFPYGGGTVHDGDWSSIWVGTRAPGAGPSSINTKGCAGGILPEGGCIYLDNTTDDSLWVDTLMAGIEATSYGWDITCGTFRISKQSPGGAVGIIHTSAWVCKDPDDSPHGPTYFHGQRYSKGTKFCAWFTGWKPDKKGCLTLK